ncbi:glycosyltransferase family 2 protein [Pullulanibacillus sp. KACC 23026]|uniref:glycosyltransferase family 2 protein n=1 Tax=Pullulanibacillus sp. KACC 23026 TaxID=3028315 RepID=UPI0023AF3242|nr:glycosyltransferase family 2 protein [Pullulanibacillus sp. KACC 23026]WEG11220.1 glycosyltransferase family 2 protein [Pullulanibacillus sp. KACC 23026]
MSMSQKVPEERPTLYIAVPCYNEEEVLPETVSRLSDVLSDLIKKQRIAPTSAMLLIDDGSKDQTWPMIKGFFETHPTVRGLKLARNAGHQNALYAGLMHAKEQADIVISIDADLQDDLNAIEKMVAKYHEGYEVVYGVRESRMTDTFFKRSTAQGFYTMMKKMGANIVFNHADFRLMSKRVLEELSSYQERNLFLRGIVPMIGFKSAEVYYSRSERFAGESKYPLKKMLAFAFDGITSLSVTPIRYVTGIGLVMFAISLIVGIYSIVHHFMGYAVAGWTSLIMSIWLIGGIQLMCLGLIGEYIGKIYKETKQRPKYHVESVLDDKANESRNSIKVLDKREGSKPANLDKIELDLINQRISHLRLK